MAKLAVVGSGHGACTYSAYLGKRGFDVHLCDLERFAGNLAPIKEAGGMELTGADTGFGKITMVTTDFGAAVKDVEVVMVVVPGFGHRPLAQALAPYLKKEHIVVLNPGSVFGGLEFLNTLRECGNQEDVTICETASNIFACRRIGPASVRVMAVKHQMEIASIPADRINDVIEKLEVFFPKLYVALPNVVYSSLMYTNMLVHPVGAALNIGRIQDTKGNFDFYWEGLTPGVCNNSLAVDAERMALGEAMGFPQTPGLEIFHRYYGHRERETFYEFFHNSEVHGGAGPSAPADTNHRYITEDIPYALVPISEVAKVFGVPTPHMDALTTVLSTCNGEDFRKTGRSLERLGLSGLGKEAIIRRFLTGK